MRLSCRSTATLLAASLAVLPGVAGAQPSPAVVQPGNWEGAARDPLSFGPANGLAAKPTPVPGRHGMVVTAQAIASQVGADMLKKGGNAVDAAVAVAYALAVVYPAAGNIGGGGFLTLRQPDGKAYFLDFREHAPLAASAAMYQDARGEVVPGLSERGWKAVAVPGTVAGMDEALTRWGRLKRSVVMAPAIKLARDGFVLTPGDVMLLRTTTKGFAADPASARIFLHPDGTPFAPGERLVQSDLADTLEQISKNGPDAFYKGSIAAEIVRASQAGGGILSTGDFAGYHTRLLAPVSCTYRGFQVDTAPPPSGGGVALCEILNILGGYDLHALGLRSAAGVQRQVEAMRHAYSDRRDLGDPDFVKDPVARLVDPAYAAAVRAAIPTDHAVPSPDLVPLQAVPHKQQAEAVPPDGHEKHETTHFSVIDKDGRAVSMTYTLNGWFGAQVVAGKTGIMLNDEMDDFSSKPGAPNMYGLVGSEANAIAPGKTPLSSMSPTILSKNGKVVMVIGSPGGSRIPTITLEAILSVVDGGADIAQAVNMPRIHEQWTPDAVEAERGALSPQVSDALASMGYRIKPHENWGAAEGILVGGPALGQKGAARFYGGVDLRHPGGAAIGE